MKITKVFESDIKKNRFKENWYWYVFLGIAILIIITDIILYLKYGM
jgi:hypothetical protein